MFTIYLYVLIYVYILSRFQETSEKKKKKKIAYIFRFFLKILLHIATLDNSVRFCLLPLKKNKTKIKQFLCLNWVNDSDQIKKINKHNFFSWQYYKKIKMSNLFFFSLAFHSQNQIFWKWNKYWIFLIRKCKEKTQV